MEVLVEHVLLVILIRTREHLMGLMNVIKREHVRLMNIYQDLQQQVMGRVKNAVA